MNEKFYMTTAIAYASKKPHIGNTYEIIMADAIARYKRQQGYDVFLMTGTDEHGQKIEELAKEAGITPKAYVDGVAGEIKQINYRQYENPRIGDLADQIVSAAESLKE